MSDNTIVLPAKIKRFDLLRYDDPVTGKRIFSLTSLDPEKYTVRANDFGAFGSTPWMDLADAIAALCKLPGAEELLKARGLRAEYGEEAKSC